MIGDWPAPITLPQTASVAQVTLRLTDTPNPRLTRVHPQTAVSGGIEAEFAICLGIDAKLAAPLAAARGLDLNNGAATATGLGCSACTRPDCPQRSAPPAGRVLVFNERERGMSPFTFDRNS